MDSKPKEAGADDNTVWPTELWPTKQECKTIGRLSRKLQRQKSMLGTFLRRKKGLYEETDAETEPLLTVLRTPQENRWREFLVAVWKLSRAELTPEARAETIELLCRYLQRPQTLVQTRHQQRGLNSLRRAAIATGLGTAFFILLLGTAGLAAPDAQIGFWQGILISIFGSGVYFGVPAVVASLSWDTFCEKQMRIAAAKALGRMEARESAALLTPLAVRESNRDVRAACYLALHGVLPALIEADYGQTNFGMTRNLCHLLIPRWKNQKDTLVPKLLAALEKIGDGSAVELVRKIAGRGQGETQAEAQRVLPILEERLAQETAQSTLLRGASAPQTAPDLLLRAANAATATTPPELLLRVAGSGNEEGRNS